MADALNSALNSAKGGGALNGKKQLWMDAYLPAVDAGGGGAASAEAKACANDLKSIVTPCLLPTAKTKTIMYTLTESEDFDREEIATYEEVARLFPRAGFFRPIVLVGPPGVGRNEIKRRIMSMDNDRYRMTIPRKDNQQKSPGKHTLIKTFEIFRHLPPTKTR